MSSLSEQDLTFLNDYGIAPEKAIRVGNTDSENEEAKKKDELPSKLQVLVESLQQSLEHNGVSRDDSQKYIEVLQRWLLMTLCEQKLQQIVRLSKQIDSHMQSADVEMDDTAVIRSEPVTGDPLEKLAIPEWNEQIFGNTYLISWQHQVNKSFYLTGASDQHGAFVISGYARSHDDVVKRLFEKETHTLPIGRSIFTEVPMAVIATGDFENKKISLTVADDIITVEFNQEEGWGVLLNEIRGELQIEVKNAKLTQDSEGKKTLTLNIPKMNFLIGDELILREGETVTLEPISSDKSGFYTADIIYNGGVLSIDARVRGDKHLKHQVEIPKIDAEKVTGELLALMLNAAKTVDDRLNAMYGLYVKPVGLNKTVL